VKRVFAVASGIAVLGSGLTGILAACSGDGAAEADIPLPERDAGSGGDDGAASSSSSTSSSSGGQPGDGSTSGDGASNDGAPTSSGATPNKIACGSATCDLPAQKCCAAFVFDGGSSLSCISAQTSCAGTELRCDDKADCASNQLCCGGGFAGAQCQPSCAGVQLCKASNECPDAGACQTFMCSGRQISACTKPSFGCQ
jgi:hypothetical protein